MESNVMAAMKAELRALDEKATALRAVITLYEGSAPITAAAAVAARAPHVTTRAPAARASNVDTVLSVARELCRDSDFPVPTRNILNAVQERGISIAGDVPQNVVSSILSRSSEFRSNGRLGWTLNENGAPEGAPDAEEAPTSSNDSQWVSDLVG